MKEPETLIDYYCQVCRKKLARAPHGTLMEIKCGRCKALNLYKRAKPSYKINNQ